MKLMHQMRQTLTQLCRILILLLPASLSFAHPHSWVDMKTRVLGEGSDISGFSMEWTFDAMTSAYMLDGEDMSEEVREATLKQLALSVIDNMLYEHYFTYFFEGDDPIRYKQVMDAKLTFHRGKLTLHFELPLTKDKDANGKNLKLMIFEPSYYVDMSWKANSAIELSTSLREQCSFDVVEPTPTAEQMAYALSLPQDADPDNTLGQLFTQHAYITCKG
ncbi:DUF1007 family protein [Vibrio nigripulchritudo]|uniref:DUF1007 family protein n=2 Tax=Vibrio nigripulchritudo TaxID=28173 RepID=UPI002490B783|nr:DUF1007 family protein [Vibrio nigripulchritudo]